MTRIFTLIIIAIFAVTVGAPVSAQTDTTFTYQGELKENGNPANGAFNIDFSLWDAASGGTQIGSTIMFNGAPVVDGQFTVELDFGAVAFDNSDRWLEIMVNGTTLAPRTAITRAPYAIQTRGIFVDGNYEVGIGTAEPLDHLHVYGDVAALRLEDNDLRGSYTVLRDSAQTQAQLQKLNLFGNVILDVDPIAADGTSDASFRLFRSTNTTGRKRVLFYRGNNTTLTSAAIGMDGEDSYFQIQGGNVGIGTPTPLYTLDVNGIAKANRLRAESDLPSDVIFGYSTVSAGAVAGVSGDSESIAGRGVTGTALSSSGETVGVYGKSRSTEGRGVWGYSDAFFGENYGVFGQSNSSSGYDFYAGGFGVDYGSPSSRRWKSNIAPIDQPLEKILRLNGVYFDWDKEHGGRHDIGMIGEEVGKVLPEIVQYEENGVDVSGMDYSKLTPLLVEAVKSLRAEKDLEIARQQVEIASLAKRLDRIKAVTYRGFEALTVEALRELRDEKDVEIAALRAENDALRTRLDSIESLVEQLAKQDSP